MGSKPNLQINGLTGRELWFSAQGESTNIFDCFWRICKTW